MRKINKIRPIAKVCTSCKLLNSIDKYTYNEETDRIGHKCIKCREITYLRQKKVRKGRERKYNRTNTLKRRYSITVEDYSRMLAEQGGGCAICKSSDPKNGKKNLCVDHCHSTGRVRGLLCGPCNRALGCFYDDISSLKRAISYLEDK